MNMQLFTLATAVAVALTIVVASGQALAAKPTAAVCRAQAKDAVGGDTYRQGKRAAAVYRSCMAGGKR